MQQLFYNEHNRRQRRVKRNGKPGASSGRNERPGFGQIANQRITGEAANRTAHLNRGPFSPQRQAAADTQRSADKLHREDPECRGPQVVTQYRFNARYSTAGSLRREALG